MEEFAEGMSYAVRAVVPADLELICEHRERMFAESGREREALRDMTDAFREWLRPRLADQTYFGWIVEDAGVPVAGVGMMVLDWPPHPSNLTDARRGYILNMFVEPNHRRRALAKRLMDEVRLEAEKRKLAYLTLHATRQGRPLYEALGWNSGTEMGLHLPPSQAVSSK